MLATILSDMINVARHSQNHCAFRKLKNGLRIHIRYTSGAIVLNLSRERVYPSETEYRIVLSNWPDVVRDVHPVPVIYHGRMSVQATIPITAVQERMI